MPSAILLQRGLIEIPKAHSREASFHGQRRRVFRRGTESLKRPARDFFSIATIGEQRRGSIRRKRHVELIEWKRESLAAGFDVRFFARPAIEECLGRETPNGRMKILDLRAREIAVAKVAGSEITAQSSNVNTYCPLAWECQ